MRILRQRTFFRSGSFRFSLPRLIDVRAAIPYGFQSFLLTLLPRIALDDEGNIIILIAFFHENAYVFRCVIAEVEPNEQGLIGKLPA